MYPVLFIHSATPGVLVINGQFCGPLDGKGQSFPAGRNAEIYIQLFPFGQSEALTVRMQLREGGIGQLSPQDSVYALVWPDGAIQLELRVKGQQETDEPQQYAAAGVLLRYLALRLAGDPQSERLLLRPQDAPALAEYEAALPLRFAPLDADPRCDERAGLMRRTAPNIAVIDAALAATVPAGQGIKRIERIEIIRTNG